MKPTLDTPLTNQEVDDLDAFLLQSGLDAPMDISMLDGFLCAVLSGPGQMPPTQWMPWIWDYEAAEQVPQFANDQNAKHVASLVMRFAREIALNLEHALDDFEPLFPERETETGSEFVIEPSFYWHDQLGEFRLSLIEPEFAEKWKDIPPNEARRQVVLGLRDKLRDLFDQQGGLHLQIGKYYPYQPMMNNEVLPRVISGVKDLLDPKRLVNPGSLGLR